MSTGYPPITFKCEQCHTLAARLAEAERIMTAWDNADAITIDHDYPQADVDEAEKIWGDMHSFLRPTVSADEVQK